MIISFFNMIIFWVLVVQEPQMWKRCHVTVQPLFNLSSSFNINWDMKCLLIRSILASCISCVVCPLAGCEQSHDWVLIGLHQQSVMHGMTFCPGCFLTRWRPGFLIVSVLNLSIRHYSLCPCFHMFVHNDVWQAHEASEVTKILWNGSFGLL